MQEKLALRRTLKKVAAIGTGVAMLGMTLTGALAADLGSIKATFGTADAVIVYGAGIETSDDQEVANSLLTGLGLKATTTTTTTGGTTTTTGEKLEFEGGQKQDIPVTYGLNDTTYGFSGNLGDNDVDGLLDATMDMDIGSVSDSYSYHEEIRLSDDTKTSVETGLTYAENQGDEWKDKVFIPMRKESVGYFFMFDKDLKTGNYIANSTTSEPIFLDFLGKTMEVQCGATGCDTDTIIVLAGEKHRLKAGESVVVGGKTITMKGCASAKASVDVDGVTDVINENSQQNLNGIKVRVQDVFNEEGIVDDEATLIIGAEAQKTYNDGDEYIGEDESDPVWVWQLKDLTGSKPDIGVWFDLSVDDPTETDNPLVEHPLYEGDYVCLPNNYACVAFESLKQSDDDFMDIEIGITTEDLYADDTDTAADVTLAKGIYLKASGTSNEGFSAGGKDTEMVFLYPDTKSFAVYRKSTENSHLIYATNSSNSGTSRGLDDFDLFTIKWKSSTIDVGYEANKSALNALPFNITINPGRHGTSNSSVLKIYFEYAAAGSAGVQSYLGHSDGDTTVANDLVWVNQSTTAAAQGLNTGTMTDISGWEENTREKYGIIVLDPKANSPSDKVKLRIPGDVTDYRANVRVARPKGAASASASSGAAAAVSSPYLKKDSEVTDLTKYNAVVVGGPCVNTHAAALLGLTGAACGEASTFKPGEAYLKLSANGDKYALLVAGWEAEDTKRAGVVVNNAASFSGLAGKQSVTVTGTGLTVDAITVA